MNRCPSCGGPRFGRRKCVVCKEFFYMRRPDQVTCASAKCRIKRQREIQKIWEKKNVGNLG